MTQLFSHPGWRNLALAVGLIIGSLLLGGPYGGAGDSTPALPPLPPPAAHTAAWWTATLLAGVGIALQHRWPLPLLLLCAVSAGLHLTLPVPVSMIDLATPILLYTVASRYQRRISLSALIAAIAVAACWSVLNAMQAQPGPPDAPAAIAKVTQIAAPTVAVAHRLSIVDNGGLSILCSVLVAAWAMGSSARNRRAYLDELHERAKDLERQRDQQAALATEAERSRISRDLHDVVAHGLSVMVVQAQGAQAALDNRPADTRTALDAIVLIGRESLADMRRVLNAVGQTDGSWHPQPGLAAVPRLIKQISMPVRLRIEGETVALAPSVDLAAYRIIQEALTNTVKHAGTGAEAQIVVRYLGRELQLEVSDNGTGPPTTGQAGKGISGMRERVRLLGGSISTGAGPDGGFLVRVWLPQP